MALVQELLERDSALEEVGNALVAGCDGRGRGLVIEGPAGIGKTRLLTAARARAEAAGMRVLAARGAGRGARVRFRVRCGAPAV